MLLSAIAVALYVRPQREVLHVADLVEDHELVVVELAQLLRQLEIRLASNFLDQVELELARQSWPRARWRPRPEADDGEHSRDIL